MKDVLWTTIRDVVIDHYADTEGTLNRTKFWLFILLQTALYSCIIAICGFLAAMPGTLLHAIAAAVTLMAVLQFALCLPTLGALVRRLKDSNNSPWLLLLVLVPFIGVFIVTILLLLPTKQQDIHLDVSPAQEGRLPKVLGTAVVLLAVTIGGFNMGMDQFEDVTIKEWDDFTKIEPGILTTYANDWLQDENATTVARSVVDTYYASLRKGDYKTAYRSLSPRQRERYGTYETWQRSLNQLELRTIESIDLSAVSADSKGTMEKRSILYTVYFDGFEYPQSVDVVMIPVDGNWRIDKITAHIEEEEE